LTCKFFPDFILFKMQGEWMSASKFFKVRKNAAYLFSSFICFFGS
jgi:hypothetical protein